MPSPRRLLPLAVSAVSLILLAASPSLQALETFNVKTLPAQMRYDVTEIAVKPGTDVKIIFENRDDMPHNMVFFQPGTDVVAASNAQMDKPEEAVKRNWLPEDPRIWMHSKLLQPKEKEEIVFKAPAKPGLYPFVCTMPGHAVIMQGKIKVFAPGPQLADLHFQVYLGDWKTLPDFAKLQPHREGPIADNLVQLNFDDYKNGYGIVYTGKLKAPSDGKYTFAIASDDGSRLLIDGKKVAENDGIHPSTAIKEADANLKAGEHTFRLEYFQAAGEAELFVAWRGPDFTMTPLSKWTPKNWQEGGKPTKTKDENTGLPLAVNQEAVLYRNFVEGAGERGIAVGYPGGISIAWSADHMNLALVWRGAFIDAARHWRGRGNGFQPPLGYDVFHPGGQELVPFAVLASTSDEWPKVAKGARSDDYHFKGYTLDARRFPTFAYEWKGVKVTDRFDVSGDGTNTTGKLLRTLKVTGPIPPGALFCLATGKSIQPAGKEFRIDAGSAMTVSAPGAEIQGQRLVLPLRAEMQVTYSWPAQPGQTAAK